MMLAKPSLNADAATCIPTSKKLGSNDKVAQEVTSVSENIEDSWSELNFALLSNLCVTEAMMLGKSSLNADAGCYMYTYFKEIGQ